ncbi:MAG TPA: hypothetical protein P5528_14455 [Steroidobacteraceae bacterium]|nr:hypothetical protein [Steroidobacteraceae bacterium]HRX90637.1 hypothetical protein [Steroidobacteraceae bacterium]
MPAVLELSVVALLVSVAILYSIWALLPWSRRLALLLAVDRWAERRQSFVGVRNRVLGPMLRNAVQRSGSACKDCAPRKRI